MKEIDEILKILEITDNEVGTKEQSIYLLDNIFSLCKDESNVCVRDFYLSNKSSIITKASSKCKNTYTLCHSKACKKCYLSKWCGTYRNSIQELEDKKIGFTFADFFCGAGGLSLGFRNNGFKVSLANDIQECCIETYRFNHPETPKQNIIAGDINDVISNLNSLKRFDITDVVLGGPPCQGFSMANRQRLIDDPRNHLYKSYIQAISKLTPKFFVMENVRGILNVQNQIEEDFGKIGYTVSARLLNAKDFGVPQNRERVIFIGNRLGIDNDSLFDTLFDYAKKQDKTTLCDAIQDMQELQAKTKMNSTELEDDLTGYTISKSSNKSHSKYVDTINYNEFFPLVFNHKARYTNSRHIELFSRLNPGDNSTDPKIQDIMPYKRRSKIFKDKYFKLEMDRPCKTITAHMKYDCNMYIHPNQARGLTPREAARIQSYPDNYFFRGSYTMTYMQVGNSVPPILSNIIAKTIKKDLEEL